MMPKRQPTIRTRLLRALMLMTLLTLGMMTILSAIMDLQLMRQHMLRDLQVLAEVVGKNCVSALVFDNPETARRHLSTLDREYQIRRALLYDAEGREFARWQRESTAMPDPVHVPPGAEGLRWLLEGRVMASQTIDFDGHPVGRIVIEARLDELYRHLRQYFLFGGALAVLTLAAALAVALRLQRRISSPILALARQSRRISEQKAFSDRITDPMAGEELATLVDGFNAVLDVIEQRKSELARHVEALNRANSQLRRLATDMALIEESERARLAGELHDSPMQKLALAQMQIDAARRGNDEESEEQLAAGVQLLSEGIAEIRTLQFDLSPPVLHQKGLPAALDWLAKSTTSRWAIPMTCIIEPEAPELGHDLSVILFQVARELVYNLIKHARANRGAIRLAAGADGLEMVIEDDGVGVSPEVVLDPGNPEAGFGLFNVRERLALIGGSLIIEPLDPGTLIIIRLPVDVLQAATGRRTGNSRDL